MSIGSYVINDPSCVRGALSCGARDWCASLRRKDPPLPSRIAKGFRLGNHRYAAAQIIPLAAGTATEPRIIPHRDEGQAAFTAPKPMVERGLGGGGCRLGAHLPRMPIGFWSHL